MPAAPRPLFRFMGSNGQSNDQRMSGPMREAQFHKRRGLQLLSTRSRIEIPEHTLNESEGTLSLWVLSLEDLDTNSHQEHIRAHDPFYYAYNLLTDGADPKNWPDATFSLLWSSGWYPQFFAKFYRGNIYPEAYAPTPKAFVAAGHWSITRHTWYQIALSWDKDQSDYRLYLNAVGVGTSNRFASLTAERCQDRLHAGNTAFVMADLCFFDHALDAHAVEAHYLNEAGEIDAEVNRELRRVCFCLEGHKHPLILERPATSNASFHGSRKASGRQN